MNFCPGRCIYGLSPTPLHTYHDEYKVCERCVFTMTQFACPIKDVPGWVRTSLLRVANRLAAPEGGWETVGQIGRVAWATLGKTSWSCPPRDWSSILAEKDKFLAHVAL